MSENHILDKLSGMKLFAEFTAGELEGFFHLMEVVHANPGECVVRQDEVGEAMFVLVEGRALVRHNAKQRDFVLAKLKSGDFFGELGLVDQGPRSADVEAVEECMLLSISKGSLRALAGVYPGAAFKFLIAVGRVLVERMRVGNRKYIDSLLVASPDN